MTDLRRLPNLAALRAFEAAARHGNFSRAAEEIHVTHGAISHQVRALEQELGLLLFQRHGKRLAITPDGQRYAALLRQSLMEIAHATDALKASATRQRLTVTALPSFAARWLAPRLGNFIDLHPDIELMLQASNQLVDFVLEPVDVGIRFGSGHYPELSTALLLEDYYYPVVSPRFNGGRLPQSPQELLESNLMRCDGEPWLPWFRAAHLAAPEHGGGLIFQDSAMLVMAAAKGQGIALARHVIAAPEIASGELVRLFDIALPCAFSYYVVCLPSALQKPQVQAFRQWLFAEAANQPPVGCAFTAPF